jgi:UDP-N-acetylglucosamine 2-epimerase (non-hydrolysing)
MKILFVLGTRPEAIKLASLIKESKEQAFFEVKVCTTGQHRELLEQATKFFGIQPDYALDLMVDNQTLGDLTSRALTELLKVYETEKPDCVVVQGDTTTALVGALAAFYKKIKIAHIEAGLRSNDKYSPFPEEMNRILISRLADFHFCPTEMAWRNLQKENVKGDSYIVGNTVTDAVMLVLKTFSEKEPSFVFPIDFSKRIILVTAHRRESFGESLREICSTLRGLADRHTGIQFIFPVHPNPNVLKDVQYYLSDCPNIIVNSPLDYPSLVWVLMKCYFVMTDSGGIQEEAAFLGKPVLVMRNVTERQEGIDEGVSLLVGTNRDRIVNVFESLLRPEVYKKMAKSSTIYGDGKASYRILEALKKNIAFCDQKDLIKNHIDI